MIAWQGAVSLAILFVAVVALGIVKIAHRAYDCRTHWVDPTYIGGQKVAGCGPVTKR